MGVPNETNKSGPYSGAGNTGPFTVGFVFLDPTHLRVVKTSVAGVESTLTYSTDYTVTGGGGSTGSITTTANVVTGEKITILRNVPKTQLTDYVEGDAFPADSHEAALDKLTMIVQQLTEELSRAVKTDVSSGTDPAVLIANLLAAAASASASATSAGNSATSAGNSATSAAASAASAASTLANAVQRTAATGSAIMPGGTTAQRDSSPVFGYTRSNSDLTRMEWWNGTSWTAMGGGATGGGADAVFYENDRTVNNNYTVGATKGVHTVGPLTITSGKSVTVTSGGRLVIL